ncbi:hypothetical protein Cni_G10634 [Canna indica]|uniref:non-specific serine/threonine protein kinase n=1 Tax=Canna indica TaxID=4628 RepID=A0AAQ3K4T4_9LILI|nr:hypothetical protein Cni_G10634 [Canna indica]
MSCFSCFTPDGRNVSGKFDPINGSLPPPMRRVATDGSPELSHRSANCMANTQNTVLEASSSKEVRNGNDTVQAFTFRKLASATKNFRTESLVGEGGFGRVYKGCLENDQLVAVKQLDRSGLQGNNEFLAEVFMLSLLHHQNLVNLIGYCSDGDQRLLVYEYMPLGSLEDHLFDITPDQRPLSWNTRMKIAIGAAKGLEYLHDANPPVIFRDLKSSNILLNEDYDAKLSDFGLAEVGSFGDNSHVSSKVMGTYGYCAPEYARTGQLTIKSDVYSFGVVLLELITGRRTIDTTRPADEQNLITWAQPMFKDRRRYCELVDPLLQGEYPEKSLNQAVAVAAMCLDKEADARPIMIDIVAALSYLTEESTYREWSSSCHFSSSMQTETKELDHCDRQDEKINLDRQRAVAEAIQWGSEFRVQLENNSDGGT